MFNDGKLSDEKLIDLFLGGERRAFDTLVDRYQRPILGLAQRMTGDSAWSEDLFQEVFIRVYRTLPSLRDPGRFRSWLYTLAIRLIRRALVKRRLDISPASVDELVDPKPVQPTVEDDGLAKLRKAIARLPERQRDVINLRTYEGLSYGEIGKILNMSEETARANHYQGLKKLRSWLGESES